MDKYHKIANDEKESVIIFNHSEEKINVYSNRPATLKKAKQSIGEPNRIDKDSDGIYSMEWDIPFSNRKNIKKILSLRVLLPPKKNTNDTDN